MHRDESDIAGDTILVKATDRPNRVARSSHRPTMLATFHRAPFPLLHGGLDRDVGYWAPLRSITDAARVRSSRSSFLRVALIHSKSRAPREARPLFLFSFLLFSFFSSSFSLAFHSPREIVLVFRAVSTGRL